MPLVACWCLNRENDCGLPFMAQKHIVEVVIDHEKFLGQLLIGDAWDELQNPLLHGAAGAVQFLQREVGH